MDGDRIISVIGSDFKYFLLGLWYPSLHYTHTASKMAALVRHMIRELNPQIQEYFVLLKNNY